MTSVREHVQNPYGQLIGTWARVSSSRFAVLERPKLPSSAPLCRARNRDSDEAAPNHRGRGLSACLPGFGRWNARRFRPGPQIRGQNRRASPKRRLHVRLVRSTPPTNPCFARIPVPKGKPRRDPTHSQTNVARQGEALCRVRAAPGEADGDPAAQHVGGLAA